jgi:NNP family nitrate/nitrite transporter-like MFS transporter
VGAGDFTTLVVVAGSLLRPVGGWLSDRIGGYRLLLTVLGIAATCITLVGQTPSLPLVVVLLFIAMGALGMGNGAVFQLVPQRFGSRMGIVTGVVGAAGGLGGFFIPSVLGAVKGATGSYAAGLLLFGAAFGVATLLLLEAGAHWSARWDDVTAGRAGLFNYRDLLRSLFADEPI